MQSRGLTRPQAVRVIVEGFFEPLIGQLDDPPLEERDPRADRRQARRGGRRHRALRAGAMTMATASVSALDLRADFPILAREIGGRRAGLPRLRLDLAEARRTVLAALDDYYRNHNANIHRGVYTLAQEADALFEGARERIAAFLQLAGRERRSSRAT